MSKVILALNAGSSSLKSTVFVAEAGGNSLTRGASAEISNLNSPPAKLKFTSGGKKSIKDLDRVKSHSDAFKQVLELFISESSIPQVKSKDDITIACHRVVHGGSFTKNELITEETFERIEELSDLAPLHNASAVALMRACSEHIPNVTNVACFDSAFHSSMPEHVKTYPIDQKIAKEKGLRKYGFHGVSYSYILRKVAEYLDKPTSETSIIALHLGSGASACAIQNGKCLDTSMGLTPVSGLPGSSRCGDIDPALIFHYTSDVSRLSPASTKELHISTAEEILNKKSGWNALCGDSDFSKIATPDADEAHRLAFDIFVDRIVGYVGSYFVKLGGKVDALVFAGGIGEKSAMLRQTVTEKVACLGFEVDESANQDLSDAPVVSIGSGDQYQVLVCQTDEEFEMAYSTLREHLM